MIIRRRSDHSTREAALGRSADILQERAGVAWREAGTAADGLEYPAGVWPGSPVGGDRSRPEMCIATHAVPVQRGAGRLAGRFLVLDAAGEDVDEETEIEQPERGDPGGPRGGRPADVTPRGRP